MQLVAQHSTAQHSTAQPIAPSDPTHKFPSVAEHIPHNRHLPLTAPNIHHPNQTPPISQLPISTSRNMAAYSHLAENRKPSRHLPQPLHQRVEKKLPRAFRARSLFGRSNSALHAARVLPGMLRLGQGRRDVIMSWVVVNFLSVQDPSYDDEAGVVCNDFAMESHACIHACTQVIASHRIAIHRLPACPTSA